MNFVVERIVEDPSVDERHKEHSRARGQQRFHVLKRQGDARQELRRRGHVREVLLVAAHL